MSIYASYPVKGGGVLIFSTLSAFPAASSFPSGTLAVAADTDILYVSTGSAWEVLADPSFSPVVSVGLADGSNTPIFSISGSPVTSSGTLTFTLNTEGANTVFAGPTSGAAAQPGFRALVAADILPVNLASTANGGITGILPIANGGTNAITAAAAFNNLNPMTTTGDMIYESGTGVAARLPVGSNNQFLQITGGIPTWTTNSNPNPITSLTGDVTGSGPGAAATTVAKIQGTVVSGTTGSTNVVFSNSPTLVTPVIGAATGTSLSVSGQLTSTLATGTAPLAVSSTTRVANLNVATAGNADTVTTNANLTGVITSVGNATSIASQTGTGTKFVVDTSPTLVTPVLGAATGTSLSVSGQLTSTVVTGTAPLAVSSTTRVANLNVATAGTADTVTTNANLTGPITSVGNATSIASQTGTGTTFAMSAGPTFTGTTLVSALTASGAAAFLSGSNFTLEDPSDNTKTIRFSQSGQTTSTLLTLANVQSTSQTLTIPNITGSDTLATLGLANAFTGLNTFTSAGNAITVTNNARVNGAFGIKGLNSNALLSMLGTTSSVAAGQWGILNNFTFNSSATTSGMGIEVALNTQAAAFTMTNMYDFYASSGSVGAGSAITRHVAFFTDGITNATNNAVMSDNSSFTGNFFINQSGTLASTFGGNVTTNQALSTAGFQTNTPTTGATVAGSANTPGLLLTPAGTLSTLTIKMPSSPIDGMLWWVASSQAITTVTWQDAGGTAGNVIGGQATIGGTNRGQTFVYSNSNTKWYATS